MENIINYEYCITVNRLISIYSYWIKERGK
jgi:hypothetical protein